MKAPTLPQPAEVAKMLSMLLGKACKVNDVGTSPIAPNTRLVIATYKSDNGAEQCAAVMELALGANAGAAMSLVPAKMAQDAAKTGKVPENIMENLQEVLNVLSGEFDRPSAAHAVLDKVYLTPPDPAADLMALINRPHEKRFYMVMVDGYGNGRMGLYILKTAIA